MRHAHIIHKYLRSENSFVFFSGLFSGFFAPPSGPGRAPRLPGAARRAKAFLRREKRFFLRRSALRGPRPRIAPLARPRPGRSAAAPIRARRVNQKNKGRLAAGPLPGSPGPPPAAVCLGIYIYIYKYIIMEGLSFPLFSGPRLWRPCAWRWPRRPRIWPPGPSFCAPPPPYNRPRGVSGSRAASAAGRPCP